MKGFLILFQVYCSDYQSDYILYTIDIEMFQISKSTYMKTYHDGA